MNLYQTLYNFGTLVAGQSEGSAKNVWTVDVKTRQWNLHKVYAFPFCQIQGRGNKGEDYPNPTFDTAKNVLNFESTFWNIQTPIFNKHKGLSESLTSFFADPNLPEPLKSKNSETSNKEDKKTNWIVLVYDGTPVGAMPGIGTDCYKACHGLFNQKLATENLEDEPSLISGAQGKGRPKAKLQPSINGVGLKRKSVKLYSVNEGANEYLGVKQGLNYLITLEEALLITEGMNYLLKSNAVCTTQSSTIIIPLNREKSHPIIPIIQGLLGSGYIKNEEIFGFWKSLEAIPDDDYTSFVLLQVRPNESRLTIRHFKLTSTAKLKANLQLFSSEFSYRGLTRCALSRIVSSDPKDREDKIVVEESVLQDTLWAAMSGEVYPSQLESLNPNRYLESDSKTSNLSDLYTQLKTALYYRSHQITLEEPNKMLEALSTGLTFDPNNKQQEQVRLVNLMNAAISNQLVGKSAYNWGRYIACFDNSRALYHARKAAGNKYEPPACREIRAIQNNPAGCFAAMSPTLYYDGIGSEFKTQMDDVLDLIKEPPPNRPLTAKQMSLVTLGFFHQRHGFRLYQREKRRVRSELGAEVEDNIVETSND